MAKNSLTYKEDVACIVVVTKVDEFICKLKNISTVEKYSGQGLGKKTKNLNDNKKT